MSTGAPTTTDLQQIDGGDPRLFASLALERMRTTGAPHVAMCIDDPFAGVQQYVVLDARGVAAICAQVGAPEYTSPLTTMPPAGLVWFVLISADGLHALQARPDDLPRTAQVSS